MRQPLQNHIPASEHQRVNPVGTPTRYRALACDLEGT
jgi:hypothetical protein